MPLYRSTIWICPIGSDNYSEKRIVEERAQSPELFKTHIRSDFIAEDTAKEQIQFGPISEINENERERKKKRIKRGFQS